MANKINIFNNAYNKLELDANNPNEEMVKRAKELFKVAEGYSTQLEEVDV